MKLYNSKISTLYKNTLMNSEKKIEFKKSI